MKVKYGSLSLRLKTLCTKFLGKPDLSRWRDLANLELEWSGRAQLIAKYIPPRSRVIDFGAGRQELQSLLPPDCIYIPSDLVDRGAGTFLCDLNAEPLPDLDFLTADVAVFAGVLEYITDLEAIPSWLAQYVTTCVASYECARSRAGTLFRLRESLERIGNGWVNTYNDSEFERVFLKAGFKCVAKSIWATETGDEQIFVFRNDVRTAHQPHR